MTAMDKNLKSIEQSAKKIFAKAEVQYFGRHLCHFCVFAVAFVQFKTISEQPQKHTPILFVQPCQTNIPGIHEGGIKLFFGYLSP